MRGPPCTPGITVLSSAWARAAPHITIPPRGPRSVLWGVGGPQAGGAARARGGAAVREVRPEPHVARLEHAEVDGHVRLRPRLRLEVDLLGAEQLLGARD